MKLAHVLIPLAVVALLSALPAVAAPVESVESARARAAFQKVDAFLGEQVVADQLAKLGVTSDQARARLAQLSDTQLEQLAAEVDLLHAGGTIQGWPAHPLGPIGCVFRQIGKTIAHVFQVLFCWNDIC